jgi:hypothetical protein
VSHYKSNLRDIEFNLFELLEADSYLGTGPFAAVDGDQARMLLSELERFARESVWADSFVPADRTPLALSPEGTSRSPTSSTRRSSPSTRPVGTCCPSPSTSAATARRRPSAGPGPSSSRAATRRRRCGRSVR